MEVVTGALPSVLYKLGELLVGEYNLQTEVRGGIKFLKSELGSMQVALEKISETPTDQLDKQDRIWARDVRELSYDIEDNIDTFIVKIKGNVSAKNHGLTKFIDKALGSLMQPKIRRKIATDIRDIKSRVEEVAKRRDRYRIGSNAKPVKVDPRAFIRYEKPSELIGIEEGRDEVIEILVEGDEASNKQGRIVSIVGFGGLGKTTLANVVYEKLRERFDCAAFVSVSQTPDMEKLFKEMVRQLTKKSNENINGMDELRDFLHKKRYLIVIDDIWDISHWKAIRHVLPLDSDGYRIITTTRNIRVAEQAGGAYKMKPLSLEYSRKLLYRRIFGNEHIDMCPDKQLLEVSDRILKKCGGVPLAIITIASLLVGKERNKMEWYDVCNSIGTGLEENSLDVDNMRKILSLSYYDMPSHLRTCLLYLSVFPEDHTFDKDRLIWMWIAEGFVHSNRQGVRQFEMGENYLNELVNRSLIQPIYDNDCGMIKSCRVHDMVLDLTRSLSSEENFITLSGWDNTSPSTKVRRLSLQNVKVDHDTTAAYISMEQVRSIIIFPHAVDSMPSLQCFRVLRVLDLQDCNLSHGSSLKYLENLLQLRYLGLKHTRIAKLPEEIGKLQFLQTLDVRRTNISCLPSAVVQLRHLMCLRIYDETRVPNGLGRLTSIEELSILGVYQSSTNIIEELAHLTELRVLDITSYVEWNGSLEKSLVKCLHKLKKIQSLFIWVKCGGCNLDGWVVGPRHLRRLQLWGCSFSRLPAWVNPLLLPDLSMLTISVRELRQEDLEILGRLPSLRYLDSTVYHEDLGIHRRFTVGASLFPCLVSCKFMQFGGPMVFQQGAMPRLTELWLDFPVRETREINGGFELGLGNLPSLQIVRVFLQSEGANKMEVKEAEAAVRYSIEIHPNYPSLDIRGLLRE